MSDWDKAVGQNIRDARKDMGLTQPDLVAEMRLYGYEWHQQTVVKVEKGYRPLRLREALCLTSVLGISVKELTSC